MKRTPTAIRQAAGVHPCKLPVDEPQPEQSSLEPPEYLTAKGRAWWREAAKTLDACGILTSADETALANYCEQFTIWRQALDLTRKKGLLITNPRTGNVRPNPSIAIANQAHDRLLVLMREFGMTPSSRASVKTRAGFKGNSRGSGSPEKPVNRFALIKGGAS